MSNKLSIDTVLSNMVEITLPNPDKDFLKVKETLTRIGIPSTDPQTGKKILWQSCHIFQKKGKLYLVHFKELFLLDGRPAINEDGKKMFGDDDIARRNSITKMLSDWGLINIVDPSKVEEPQAPVASIKIVKFAEKNDWVLSQKYTIGSKRKNEND